MRSSYLKVSLFHDCLMNRQCLLKKTQLEKKGQKVVCFYLFAKQIISMISIPSF